MTTAEPRAACTGQWQLFDSRHLADHAIARRICQTCPVVPLCAKTLRETKVAESGVGKFGGPEGTWAGRLIGRPTQRRSYRPRMSA